jgi:recombination protein RecR
VVEQPRDLMAIEQSGVYRGCYHVLLGRVAPLEGIGPEQLTIDRLVERIREGNVQEVIMATNPTVEGEATAYFLQRMAGRHGIAVSRIAHGVPLGGELEFTDQSTIAHAFTSRQVVDQ